MVFVCVYIPRTSNAGVAEDNGRIPVWYLYVYIYIYIHTHTYIYIYMVWKGDEEVDLWGGTIYIYIYIYICGFML